MREIISLNENWTLSFPKGERPTEQVTLPHTWNAVDGMDGNGSYLRTTGVYTRTFTQPKQPLAGGRTYVEVLAAALAATVKVNGQVATTHEGGFSIFRADVTDLCHEGDNELTIEVSNEDTPSMYPASADFTFYGGLYRGVNLISVPGTHFDLDYFGGPGIKVTPKPTEDGGATFEIESWVTNGEEAYTVMYSIEDCYGNEVASGVRPCDSTKVTLYVPDAQLWSMDEPNLYTVTARLQKNNETFDEIYANVGVRSYTVTPNDGFSINGVPTPLRGGGSTWAWASPGSGPPTTPSTRRPTCGGLPISRSWGPTPSVWPTISTARTSTTHVTSWASPSGLRSPSSASLRRTPPLTRTAVTR